MINSASSSGRLNAGVFSSSSDQWATPQDLFDLLNSEFHFTLDVCASDDNAKCASYYTIFDNALLQPWARNVCFMNPPYSKIGDFMHHAWVTARDGSTVVCLVPARTDTRWFWSYALPGEIRLLPGRLKFGGGKNSAPFPSCVVVLRPGLPADWRRIWAWDWRSLAGACK